MEKTKLQKLIQGVEQHSLRCTALCDDGSAFFVPVGRDGQSVVGDVLRLTPAKIKALAALKPLAKV